jgi:hypothetical protein
VTYSFNTIAGEKCESSVSGSDSSSFEDEEVAEAGAGAGRGISVDLERNYELMNQNMAFSVQPHYLYEGGGVVIYDSTAIISK